MSGEIKIDPKAVVIGQYSDYFDTGMWDLSEGGFTAPPDLTLAQLKDFLTASGGAVFLGQDGRFRWFSIDREGGSRT